MQELWDAYDARFHRLEGVTLVRGEPVPEGMYHLVSEIIVRHTDGTLLLMQRDPRKHLGGMWELTAGGSALQGETPLMCAQRELREETGIVPAGLQQLRRIVHEGHRTLYVEYLCVTDADKQSVTLQQGETVAFRWTDRETVAAMGPDVLCSSRSAALLREGLI